MGEWMDRGKVIVIERPYSASALEMARCPCITSGVMVRSALGVQVTAGIGIQQVAREVFNVVLTLRLASRIDDDENQLLQPLTHDSII